MSQIHLKIQTLLIQNQLLQNIHNFTKVIEGCKTG